MRCENKPTKWWARLVHSQPRRLMFKVWILCSHWRQGTRNPESLLNSKNRHPHQNTTPSWWAAPISTRQRQYLLTALRRIFPTITLVKPIYHVVCCQTTEPFILRTVCKDLCVTCSWLLPSFDSTRKVSPTDLFCFFVFLTHDMCWTAKTKRHLLFSRFFFFSFSIIFGFCCPQCCPSLAYDGLHLSFHVYHQLHRPWLWVPIFFFISNILLARCMVSNLACLGSYF